MPVGYGLTRVAYTCHTRVGYGLGQSLREMWGFITSGSDTKEVTGTPPPPEGPASMPSKRVVFGKYGESVAVRSAACGLAHSAAIVGDGELWTWGRNDEGQCGVSGVPMGDEAGGQVLKAAHVEAVHDALAGGAVTLVACGANFTAAYSADTHLLAVCGGGAKEFVGRGRAAAATEWHQIPLVAEDGSNALHKDAAVLVQLAAGYGHLVMLTGQRVQLGR